MERACTDAHNRVRTLAIAPDQTRREGRHEAQKQWHQHAASTRTCTSMHSQLHGAVQWVGIDTAQWLAAFSAHLCAIAAQSAIFPPRSSMRASSRPKNVVIAREDRVYDGVPTVEVAQVVEVVGIRDGVVTPSRPS